MRLPRLAADGSLTSSQKKILSIMLNGDPQSGLLMHIIRFVMPSKSKPLKKLMYFFFEVCPKHDAQGKLRQEWILVWWVDMLPCGEDCTDIPQAMPFVSTCKRRTNMYGETHCDSCRHCRQAKRNMN
jgi:hypothetical protein